MQEKVKQKKYFYALRPLLACQYIEQYNSVPPVLFDDLLQMDLPTDATYWGTDMWFFIFNKWLLTLGEGECYHEVRYD